MYSLIHLILILILHYLDNNRAYSQPATDRTTIPCNYDHNGDDFGEKRLESCLLQMHSKFQLYVN